MSQPNTHKPTEDATVIEGADMKMLDSGEDSEEMEGSEEEEEVLEPTAPANRKGKPTKAATKSATAKKTKKKTGASELHPKYSQMVNDAIADLKERNGSSRQAILKYILANYSVQDNQRQVNNHLKMSLRAGVKSGKLRQAKGSGACGSYKLGAESSAAVKASAKNSKVQESKSVKPAKVAKPPKTTSKTKASPKKKESQTKSTPKKKASPTKKTPAKAAKSPVKKTSTRKAPKKKPGKVAKKTTKKKP